MNSVLVTGCNRGIGLSLIKQFLSKNLDSTRVIATCRNKDKAPELIELGEKYQALSILELDLKNFDKFENFAKEVEVITQDNGLNLLINNAGISTKFTRISMLKLEDLLQNFVINAAAPIMLTKALLSELRKGSLRKATLPMGIERSAVINISSILGSIKENKDGGFYPYRCSKTALNAATRSLSHDLKKDGILTVAVHPGWVKTDMGGKSAPLDADVATATLLKTLKTLKEEHSGTFIQYDGKTLDF